MKKLFFIIAIALLYSCSVSRCPNECAGKQGARNDKNLRLKW